MIKYLQTQYFAEALNTYTTLNVYV